MKILFSALGYPTKSHPFAAFIAMMAEEFARRGHEVTVLAPQSITRSMIRGTQTLPTYESIVLKDAIYPIYIYRPKSFTFGEGKIRGYLTTWSNRLTVNKCLKKINKKFDVIYAHFWEAAYYAFPYAELMKLPLVVVSGEDKVVINKYISEEQKEALKRKVSKTIGVSSKNIKESILKGLTTQEKSIVIPNGADTRVFHPIKQAEVRQELGLPQDSFIIAFTGRFIYRKGALRVKQAIDNLNDKTIKAIFIGSTMKDDDPSQEPYGENIIFKGILDHDIIPKWLSASDVFVLPTLAEGCSNSIVEALACGLPVISSNLPFNYDILDDTNSILVDPLNITQISEAIKKIKDDRVLAMKMSDKALKKTKELCLEKRCLLYPSPSPRDL